MLSLATVLAVAALAHPATRLGPIVGCRPMRWIGERSYGIYLWHFPIIVLTTPEGAHGVDLLRAVLQVAAIFAVAALSWTLRREPDPPRRPRPALAALAGRRVPPPARSAAPALGRDRRRRRLVVVAALAGLAGVDAGPSQAEATGEHLGRDDAHHDSAVDTPEIKDRTSCNSVVHIGDSTSEGLVSPDYLPNRKDQIAAQYARVGATTQHLEVSGARSIYETLRGPTERPGSRAGLEAARASTAAGCSRSAPTRRPTSPPGSTIGYDERIDRMMNVADGDPVLWVNVRSLVTDGGPYANSNMQGWDEALLAACEPLPEHADLRLGLATSRTTGSSTTASTSRRPATRPRSKLIADALLNAFPAGGEVDNPDNADCLVGSDRRDGRRDDFGRDRRDQRPTTHDERLSGRQPGATSALLEVRPAVVEAERDLEGVAADLGAAAAADQLRGVDPRAVAALRGP